MVPVHGHVTDLRVTTVRLHTVDAAKGGLL